MLIQADSALIPLPDKSVHCVTTSPPYWGLRKYSGEQGRGMFPDLGLEKTPQEFIHNMVMIFREVRRVLRDDGVVWLNLGDSYSGSGGPGSQWDTLRGGNTSSAFEKYDNPNQRVKNRPGGNLMMMPHRVAIALQDDGWIVRNDVVWWKRNPMPESQTGWFFKAETGELKRGSFRHTRAHEYIFMLSKKMGYWANQEAVRERHAEKSFTVHTTPRKGTGIESKGERFNLWLEGDGRGRRLNPSGRNPRSVMDVPTAPYKGAHYATFPPNLIAPLTRATCPRWACPVCGQGWSPVVERTSEGTYEERKAKGKNQQDSMLLGARAQVVSGQSDLPAPKNNIKEYRPTCSHDHTKDEAVPGVVLDPFVGSGTTVMVAKQLLRRGIGLDISMEYIDQQAKVRTGEGSPSGVLDDLPLFALIGD